MLSRLKEETSTLIKERDHIQYKLEKNVIFQQYLEKVLEAAEEVPDYYPAMYISCFFKEGNSLMLLSNKVTWAEINKLI